MLLFSMLEGFYHRLPGEGRACSVAHELQKMNRKGCSLGERAPQPPPGGPQF